MLKTDALEQEFLATDTIADYNNLVNKIFPEQSATDNQPSVLQHGFE